MRVVLGLAALLFLGGVVAAIAFWSGADAGAPIAFALAAFAVGLCVTVGISQVGNWGVPGDEPKLRWQRGH